MEKPHTQLREFSIPKNPDKTRQVLSPGTTLNQIQASPQHNGFIHSCCMGSHHFGRDLSCRVGRMSREFWQPAGTGGPQGLMQHREPEDRGAAPARMTRLLHPGEVRGDRCQWKCETNRYGTTACDEDLYSHLDSEEEYLEPPLPLISDDEWQHYRSAGPPHHYHYGEGRCSFDPVRYPQQCQHSAPCWHRTPWTDPHKGYCCHADFMTGSSAQGSVSVNNIHFFTPPSEDVSQVNVMNLHSLGTEVFAPNEKRRTITLPEESRKIFITYSSDISSAMIPFADFLAENGFQPAIDICHDPVRGTDINEWKDSYLVDPSTLIIIAISPKYKADIEGSVVDNHSLHTRYIYTMMKNEFIQQGSLNFRFIPVLFPTASQKHVPSWLQNTHVYHWPRETEDLVLRLLRQEKYVPPPVPMELTLVIRPVTSSSTDSSERHPVFTYDRI